MVEVRVALAVEMEVPEGSEEAVKGVEMEGEARAGAARRIEAADRRMREETRVILISVLAVRERGLARIQTVSGRRRQVTLG